MPIYEYVCRDCGQRFEKFFRSMRGSAELVCPHCGSSRAQKALSLFGSRSSGGRPAAHATSAGACGPVT